MVEKFHATPTGQIRRCVAEKRSCKYGEALHGKTREEVQKIIDEGMTDVHGAFAKIRRERKKYTYKYRELKDGTVIRLGKRMTAEEAKRKDETIAKLKERLAKNDEQVDTRPFKDKEREFDEMSDLILSSAARELDRKGNTIKVKMLSHASISAELDKDSVINISALSSQKTGEFQIDDYLDRKAQLDAFNDKLSGLRAQVSAFAIESSLPPCKVELDGESAKISLTLANNGVNSDVLAKLKEEHPSIYEAITDEKPSISVDLVREHVPSELQEKVLNTTLVLDGLAPRLDNLGQDRYMPHFDTSGNSAQEQVSSALASIDRLYTDARVSYEGVGTIKRLKAVTDAQKDVIKATVKDREGSSYIPSRKAVRAAKFLRTYKERGGDVSKVKNADDYLGRGVLITSRETVNSAACRKVLPADILAKVTKMERKINKEKAEAVLTPEQFSALFSSRTATIYVKEKDEAPLVETS